MVAVRSFRQDRKSGLWTPNRKPPLQSRIDWSHPLAPIRDGVIGFCYLINERGGNTLYSLAKNGDLAFGNDPAWVPGQDGPVVELDGGNDYLRNQNGITGIGSEGTFTFRLKPKNLHESADRGFIEISDSTTGERILFYAGGGATQRLFVFSPDDVNYWELNPNPLQNDIRYTISLTYKFGAQSNLYVNGDVLTADTSNNLTAQVGLDSVLVGAYGAGTPANFLEADWDFLYYHPWVLSAGEIFQLFWNPYCFVEPLRPHRGALWEAVAAVGGIVPYRYYYQG